MTEPHEKSPAVVLSIDKPNLIEGSAPNAPSTANRAPEYAGYGLAFLSGCLVTLALHYMLRGTSIQLSPESFVSLVFTIAVGAASLVLAIVAINYGRISERVMTERSDRSIDIQMNLFQKSLDLQTQLFDKTMSTLESIGRSTGVTEQRLSDMHSFMQNPSFVKQIAGRAVEQTTSELSTSGKAGGQEGEFETHLAEKLTKNIVEELSSRWEFLNRPISSGAASVQNLAVPAVTVPPKPQMKTFVEQATEYKTRRAVQLFRLRLQSQLEQAIGSIPGAKIERNEGVLGQIWENRITYKAKTSEVDIRPIPSSVSGAYDSSIQKLFDNAQADCLIFLFGQPPAEEFKKYLEDRSRTLEGRVRFVTADGKQRFQNDLLAILESVAAELPSVE
jgi:hypothetical protein